MLKMIVNVGYWWEHMRKQSLRDGCQMTHILSEFSF